MALISTKADVWLVLSQWLRGTSTEAAETETGAAAMGLRSASSVHAVIASVEKVHGT